MHISNENFYSQELDVHIKNIEKQFGALSPATAKITIDPKNVEKQRMAMFPGAFNRSEDDQSDASNEDQPNDTPSESSCGAVTSDGTPSKEESNGSRMQQDGLGHSTRSGLGQKRQADANHPLRNDESSSSTKKTATAHDNVTSTTN